jgi:hypothetical protein
MADLAALTAAYSHLLLRPVLGSGVCETCFNLTDGYRRCYACAHLEQWVDLVVPISYSVAHEQLHHVLAGYKRWPAPIARQSRRELTAILERHLHAHETCHAVAAGIEGFNILTTVPAGTPDADVGQPLRQLVADTAPARDRYSRLLVRSDRTTDPRHFDPDRFTATTPLAGESVLLIDDMWTTGASAQSAAAVLKAVGAGTVVALVIGRHVNRGWGDNDRILKTLERPYDWDRCVSCPPSRAALTPSPLPAAAG